MEQLLNKDSHDRSGESKGKDEQEMGESQGEEVKVSNSSQELDSIESLGSDTEKEDKEREETKETRRERKITEVGKKTKKNGLYIITNSFFGGIGTIMRFYMCLCEFYFCLQLVCFSMNCMVVFFSKFGNRFDGRFIFFIMKISALVFLSFLLEKPMTMVFWEFLGFHWFNDKIFSSFQEICNMNTKSSSKFQRFLIDWFLAIILGVYLLLAMLGALGKGFVYFDYFHLVILFYLPLFKFTALYIIYFSFAIVSFRYNKYPNGNKFQSFLKSFFFFFLPKIQPTTETISDPFIISLFRPNRYLVKERTIDETEEEKEYNKRSRLEERFNVIIKSVLSLAVLLYLFVILFNMQEKGIGQVSFMICLWFFLSFWAFTIKMPMWITAGFYGGCTCFSRELIQERSQNDETRRLFTTLKSRIRSPRIFPFVQYFFYIFEIFILLGVVTLLAINNGRQLKDLNDDFEGNNKYNGIPTIVKKPINKDDYILNQLCYTKVHSLSFLQLSAFAGFAYYDFEDNYEEGRNNQHNETFYFEKNFLRKANDATDLTLKTMDLISNDTNKVVVLKAEVMTNENKTIRVYAIKGSSTGFDWLADFEMVVSSTLFSAIRTFPIILSRESETSRVVTKFFTFPVIVMKKATKFESYVSKLKEVIGNDLSKYPIEKNNAVITGHSLGGALSKMMGMEFGIQSVSFSGFGVTPISHLFENADNNITYRATMVDVIPDLDLVPRLDQSGGVRYRLVCSLGVAECHYIKNTICMIGISCLEDFYSREICEAYLSEEVYTKMKKLAFKEIN